MSRNAPLAFPKVQALPDARDRASLRIDGVDRVGYEFGPGAPRPFLFPIVGPSGAPLTRIGHPNPVGHEHHRSVSFGHQRVAGVNVWEERPGSDVSIRHGRVALYHDGPDGGGLGAELTWWASGRAL